ncbi:U2 snRNP complex subunit BUD31 PWA37_004680 [Arxiozyma heterogenica]|uniref:G10 protein n=1 Tax=Arxiozyma heterogenica TaxID=278026 RepID=A0AAN7W5P8_9SACH|nr:hypothetical protein RI543_000960 [Kazachstania heterogenica]
MSSIKSVKNAPKGFNKISPILYEFERRLKEVERYKESNSKLSVKARESIWKIIQINHERSLYVYKLYYRRKLISRELYLYLIKHKYCDKHLIAKWKKQGYEKLCCLLCIQSDETTHGKTCICRVPRTQLELEAEKKGTEVKFKQCIHCGCRGCASTD